LERVSVTPTGQYHIGYFRCGGLQHLHMDETWLFLDLARSGTKALFEHLPVRFSHGYAVGNNEHRVNSFTNNPRGGGSATYCRLFFRPRVSSTVSVRKQPLPCALVVGGYRTGWHALGRRILIDNLFGSVFIQRFLNPAAALAGSLP
jgi:hypothetical protein